jgi:uncharacterized protein (TIGR03000 family)
LISSRPALPPATNPALLEVQVPEQATVYVNGLKTKSTGSSRRYAWKALAPGRVEDVEVRAEITRNGKLIQQTKTAHMRGGVSSRVSFDFESPETSLTLKVPPDATVFLAGNAMTEAGSVRSFRTTKLAAGQQWPEYKIRVTVERNGQLLSKEQRILLKSGDTKSLTFSFDESLVAAAE